MKRVLPLALALLIAGCADFGNHLQRGLFSNTAGDYHILKYSGGKVVEDYWVRHVKVTQNEHTDGLFFIWHGAIIEVQGDVTSVRLAHDFAGPEVLPPQIAQGVIDAPAPSHP